MTKNPSRLRIFRRTCSSGVTLIELMVAMAVFITIAGSALMLFRKHVPLMTAQQNQTALNVAMRNAAAQMQIDTVNAGVGFLTGINIPGFPLGVTIAKGTGTCFSAAGNTYSSGCFDTLNILMVDQNTPPANASDIGTNCVSSTASTLFANPTGSTTAAQLASDYHNGDWLLLVKSDGSQINTVQVTKDGQVSGNKVQLQHNPTGTGADPYGIYQLPTNADDNKLGTQFCTTDWVLRLSGNTMQYRVDATDPTNPKLIRQVGPPGATTTSVVADQVIGFRVGALAQRYNPGQPDNGQYQYYYDPSLFNYDWTTIRALRISLIGRTNPTGGAFAGFRNNFDNGPYKVEGVSIVINPRNLSWN
jgi:prepilin-type N-terminal cleavage/methylation domain-containing protein